MIIDTMPMPSVRRFVETLFADGTLKLGHALYALLDHALAPEGRFLDEGPVARLEARNLYSHLGGADKRHSPWLLELPPDQAGQLDALTRLLMQSDGLPMLSILSCPLSVEDLAAHLGFHAKVALPPESRAYLLRFADTRIVPVLSDLLEPDQRRQFFGPIGQWAFPDRHGHLAIIRGEGAMTPPPDMPLALNEAQLDAFTWATLPDSILARLQEEASWPAQLSPSARHHLVCQWIEETRTEAGEQAEPGTCLAQCLNALAALS